MTRPPKEAAKMTVLQKKGSGKQGTKMKKPAGKEQGARKSTGGGKKHTKIGKGGEPNEGKAFSTVVNPTKWQKQIDPLERSKFVLDSGDQASVLWSKIRSAMHARGLSEGGRHEGGETEHGDGDQGEVQLEIFTDIQDPKEDGFVLELTSEEVPKRRDEGLAPLTAPPQTIRRGVLLSKTNEEKERCEL